MIQTFIDLGIPNVSQLQRGLVLADDESTATFLGLLVGFIETDEQIEEREDPDAICDEHAAIFAACNNRHETAGPAA